LYSLQVSLAALWQSWGCAPDAVLGYGAGEYAAACVAGVFRVEDGLDLVTERVRLMQTLPARAMLSVTAPAHAVETVIRFFPEVCISAYAGPNTVISGPLPRLEALRQQFDAQELYCRMLPASNAFHSPAVEPILQRFEAYARGIEYGNPSVRLISGMSGKELARGETADALYWTSHARRPVRFGQAVQSLFEDADYGVALELGPHAELTWQAQMSVRPARPVVWASSLAKDRDALGQLLSSAAQLHASGVTLDLAGMQARLAPRCRLALPSYPFQHRQFWPGETVRPHAAAV
jgi:acyl transferase domain-containing protein